MPLRNIVALLAILAGLIGLALDFVMIVPALMAVSETNPVARSLPDVLIYFWTFFTHLTNLGLILVYVGTLSGWRWLGWFARPRTQAAMGGYILLVMLYYHFMLAPYLTFDGPLLYATVLLHYVAPIFYLVWWALFAPHGTLRYVDIPSMLVPGVIYVAWALGRGAITSEYPYDILDAGKFGYGQVAIGVTALVIAVIVFCAIMVTADKLLARVNRTQSA